MTYVAYLRIIAYIVRSTSLQDQKGEKLQTWYLWGKANQYVFVLMTIFAHIYSVL